MVDVLRELDLSPGSLLRSGSYILWLAIAALLWSRRAAHPWNSRLAAAYALTGIGGCAYNVIGANTADLSDLSRAVAVPTTLLTAGCSLAAGIAWWPLAASYLQPGRPRVAGLAIGGAIVGIGIANAVVAVRGQDWFALEPIAYRVGLLLPVMAGLAASAEARDRLGRRCALFWAAAFPLWAEAMLYAGGAIGSPHDYAGALAVVVFAASPVLRLATSLWGLRAAARSRTILVLTLASLLIATVGALLGDDPAARLGISGIVLVGATLASLLLLRREGLLRDVEAKARAPISKGMVASFGLAALFITAQVAQNFFSAKIGLYSGGIVAGVVVFAAYPLQRAAERAVERRPRSDDGPLAIYRSQVEVAWKDGRLGANERMMLRDLRLRLGLGADEAEAVDHEVAAAHAGVRGPASGRASAKAK